MCVYWNCNTFFLSYSYWRLIARFFIRKIRFRQKKLAIWKKVVLQDILRGEKEENVENRLIGNVSNAFCVYWFNEIYLLGNSHIHFRSLFSKIFFWFNSHFSLLPSHSNDLHQWNILFCTLIIFIFCAHIRYWVWYISLFLYGLKRIFSAPYNYIPILSGTKSIDVLYSHIRNTYFINKITVRKTNILCDLRRKEFIW